MTDKTTSPPPAYFLSLSLENVRSFGEKQTISFARPDGRPAQWTIILGDNGVGKTTVLKALAASTNKIGSFDGQESYGATLLDFDWYSKWWPVRNLKLATKINTQVEGGTILSSQEKARFFGDSRIYLTRERSSIAAISIDFLGFRCYGYGAGRTTGNSNLGEATDDYDTNASLFYDRADLLNPEEWFLNIDYGSKLAGDNAGQLNRARTLVESMLKTVLPGVTELRIASTGTPQKPQISLQFLLFGTWVRLRDMSLGYQTLVVWLTDFASKLFIRYPDSPNPLEEPAIVLIDEIDLHLHPRWQRKLLRFLSDIFVNTQFIATAHSPLVVQAAGDMEANVVLLKRDGDQTKVYENPIDVRNWRVDQILTSTFFNLETARSVETEKKMARQATLLNKVRLSAKERHELDALTIELEGESMGSVDGEEDEEAMLRELTRRVGKRPKA